MPDASPGEQEAVRIEAEAGTQYRSTLAGVARNSAAMLTGQVVIKLASFMFSVFVVRKLGASDFGIYQSIMAYAFILAMLTDLGTSSLSVREIARVPESAKWIIPNVISLRVILSVLLIAGNTMSAWLLGRPAGIVLGTFLASFGLLLYAFQGPLDGLLIARERLDLSSLFNVMNQITFVILGAILLFSGGGYIGLLFSTLAGVFLMTVAANWVVRRVLRTSFEKPDVKKWFPLLRASAPFGVIGLVSDFTARFDTVFMSFILTFSEVGYYNVSLNLIFSLLLIAQSLALSIYPTMVREFRSGQGSIQDIVQRALRFMLILSIPIAVGGSLLSNQIVTLVYGSEFSTAAQVLKLMVWALPMMYLAEILGRTTITMHLEKKEAWLIVVNAVISIILSLLLIPRFGVFGATWVLLINQVINIILSAYIIGPGMLLKDNVWPILRIIAAGALMGGVVWFVQQIIFYENLGELTSLLSMVGIGGIVYVFLIFILQAITPGEAKFLVDTIRRKTRRLHQE
jgi:O-antigen/teichoic acid export membrane protein